MTMLRGRIRRRHSATLLVAGAATVTLDQRMSKLTESTGREALAGDWRAVGRDLRSAMDQVGRGFKAA